MFKALAWVGLYVGMPSVITWLTAVYASIVDQFVLFFAVSVCALLIAFLPRLFGASRS